MDDSSPESPVTSQIGLRWAIGAVTVILLGLAVWLVIPRKARHPPVALTPARTPAPAPAPPPADVDGIAPGATLGLRPITTEEVADENSAKHILLHIPITAWSGTTIDIKDVVIHALFYDLVDGTTVEQTSANVHTRWANPPADWLNENTEELVVEYQLPKPNSSAALPEDRKYYGYLVRIYYRQQLQAATALPERLAQQYPPPLSLAKGSAAQTTPAPAPPADTSKALPGIAVGATLGLWPIVSEDQADEKAVKHFSLRIPIKARPHVRIAMESVVVQVLFYDLVAGTDVVQTSAKVNTRWATPPADWVNTDTEELDVDYQLLKPDFRAATPPADRKYYGYLVRIYYQGQLQAATAQPEQLAQQNPPPPTLKESGPAEPRPQATPKAAPRR